MQNLELHCHSVPNSDVCKFVAEWYEEGQRKRKTLKEGRSRIEAKRNLLKANRLSKQEKLTLEKAKFALQQLKKELSEKELSKGGKEDFLSYWEKVWREEKKCNPSYQGAYKALQAYAGTSIIFEMVNFEFIEGFYRHLVKTGIHRNTIIQYISRFSIIWNHALKRDFVSRDPFKKFKHIYRSQLKRQDQETHRLTKEQLTKLENTPFPIDPIICQAFIFCCYTGLRYSDVIRIKGKNIVKRVEEDVLTGEKSEVWVLSYRQKKSSRKHHELTLHPKAVTILDSLGFTTQSREKREKKIFKGLPSISSAVNLKLIKWADSIGLDLNFRLSWHKSRHTFGTLLYQSCADIKLVKESMGHSNLQQTERYARLDKQRQRKAIYSI